MIANFLVKMSLIAAHCVWSRVVHGAEGHSVSIFTFWKASVVSSSAAGTMFTKGLLSKYCGGPTSRLSRQMCSAKGNLISISAISGCD